MKSHEERVIETCLFVHLRDTVPQFLQLGDISVVRLLGHGRGLSKNTWLCGYGLSTHELFSLQSFFMLFPKPSKLFQNIDVINKFKLFHLEFP
jgi:hypothetical protein